MSIAGQLDVNYDVYICGSPHEYGFVWSLAW